MAKVNLAKLGPNLMLFRFKVKTNGVLCLLDLGTTHSFVNPSAITQLEWVAIKVAKPIRVQLAQGVTTLTSNLWCWEQIALWFTHVVCG
jgi:hypothetical protein